MSFKQYSGLPLVGSIQTNGGSRSLHISQTYDKDERAEDTMYVATSNDHDMPVVFLFIVDVERGGLLLQAVENRSGGGRGKTDGMYLAVHNALPDDSLYEGFVRVIVHHDVAKAALWTFTEVDGQKLLQVKENPDETGADTVGCFLAVPPDSERDHDSSYVAVTADVDAATPVTATAVAVAPELAY